MERTTYIIIAIVAILVILILFGCFWGKMSSCMSSNCPLSGSSDCFSGGGKKGCDSKGYCKKCGTIPCCCNNADIVSVTRTYLGPVEAGANDPDEYAFTIEGSGLTSSTITNIIVQVTGSAGGAVISSLTQNFPGTGDPIVYGTSGYHMTIVYQTEPVGVTDGPQAANNMSPLITHVLTGSVLTITVVMPVV